MKAFTLESRLCVSPVLFGEGPSGVSPRNSLAAAIRLLPIAASNRLVIFFSGLAIGRILRRYSFALSSDLVIRYIMHRATAVDLAIPLRQ